MILQEEFEKNGYTNILFGDNASKIEIDLEDIFDTNNIPRELLGIFISEQRDEMFFVLDGNFIIIDQLCKKWDDKIRVFTLINGKKVWMHNLKYNIVQLIIYSGNTPDKSQEGSIEITRKIIIKGDMTDRKQIVIDDEEAIELPFHMIKADAFAPNEEKISRLVELMPDTDELKTLMETKRKKNQKKEKNGEFVKSFTEKDYIQVKEWLERC